MTLADVVARAEALAFDLDLKRPKAWKAETGGKLVGYLPIYVPREIVHAAGALPVGILGGGDRLEIIRGDAFFQSYICHLPRSVVELLVGGRLDAVDGFLFPSTCDVIRNLSGVFQLLRADRWVRYFDAPQNFDPESGGRWYERDLRALAQGLAGLTGRAVTDESLVRSIALYNENRRRIDALDALRRERPWLVPASEFYCLLRAGAQLPVEEHTELLATYHDLAARSARPELDLSRVVVVGTFCEQPPLGLIKTLERAGCYVVGDDFLLGLRWLRRPVPQTGDPFRALVATYLEASASAASRYVGDDRKGRELIETVRSTRAEGVVFAAASFCDPALLDQPMLQAALDRAGIQHTAFKYSEDTGQFAVIREQAGTFADSIRLWAEA